MFDRLCIAGILGCSLIASAETLSQPAKHYSRHDLKILIRTAHTPEQYRALSIYFHQQAEHFRLLAKGQEQEMRYALEHPGGPKYPTAYDDARHLSLYYENRANEASQKANNYEQKLQPEGPASAPR